MSMNAQGQSRKSSCEEKKKKKKRKEKKKRKKRKKEKQKGPPPSKKKKKLFKLNSVCRYLISLRYGGDVYLHTFDKHTWHFSFLCIHMYASMHARMHTYILFSLVRSWHLQPSFT